MTRVEYIFNMLSTLFILFDRQKMHTKVYKTIRNATDNCFDGMSK